MTLYLLLMDNFNGVTAKSFLGPRPVFHLRRWNILPNKVCANWEFPMTTINQYRQSNGIWSANVNQGIQRGAFVRPVNNTSSSNTIFLSEILVFSSALRPKLSSIKDIITKISDVNGHHWDLQCSRRFAIR